MRQDKGSQQPHERGSNETSESEGMHPPRQLYPRGEVPASKEEVNETLTTSLPLQGNKEDELLRDDKTARTQRRQPPMHGAQGIRREIFKVGVKGQ